LSANAAFARSLRIVSTSPTIAPVPLTIGSGEPALATIRFSAA
jgi:hypothetical protein